MTEQFIVIEKAVEVVEVHVPGGTGPIGSDGPPGPVDQDSLAAVLATGDTRITDVLSWSTDLPAALEGAASGLVQSDSWAGLSAVVGTRAAQPGRVTGGAGTTHSDPVTSLTVKDQGEYSWSVSPAGWKRIGEAPLAGKATNAQAVAATNDEVGMTPKQTGVVAAFRDAKTLRALDDFGSSNIRDYTGSIAAYAPIVSDAFGRMLFYINSTNGELKGRFDIADEFNRKMRNEFGQQTESIRDYTGSGPIWPIIVDAAGRALIWFNSTTNQVNIPELNTSGLGGGGSSSAGLTLQKREPLSAGQWLSALSSSVWFGFLSYGQSLSIGSQGQPPISTTALYNNLTFTAGPKTTLTGNSFGGSNQSAMNTSKLLVEDSLSGDVTSGRGETVCSGTVNGCVELAAIENQIDPASLIFFASAPGLGGASIDILKDGQPWNQDFIDHVTQAKAIAVAAGKSYEVALVSFMGGEADTGKTLSAYKTLLNQFINDAQTRIMAITGQTNPPHFVFYQQGSGLKTGANAPALSQYQLSVERADCWMGTPIYHLEPAADNIHTINTAYHYIGRAYARVLKSILVDRLKPLQFTAKGAVQQGSVIRVRFDAPALPLVFDIAALGPVQNKGFKVVSDAGTATISDVVIDGSEVVITTSGTVPTTNVRVRYALDYAPASHPSGKLFSNGAAGNLRDSTPDKYVKGGVTRALPFWCPSLEIPVFKAES